MSSVLSYFRKKPCHVAHVRCARAPVWRRRPQAALVAPSPPAGAPSPPIRGLTELRHLNLSQTQVTDAGCATIYSASDPVMCCRRLWISFLVKFSLEINIQSILHYSIYGFTALHSVGKVLGQLAIVLVYTRTVLKTQYKLSFVKILPIFNCTTPKSNCPQLY